MLTNTENVVKQNCKKIKIGGRQKEMKGSRDSTQSNREEKEIDKQRTGQRLLNPPLKTICS